MCHPHICITDAMKGHCHLLRLLLSYYTLYNKNNRRRHGFGYVQAGIFLHKEAWFNPTYLCMCLFVSVASVSVCPSFLCPAVNSASPGCRIQDFLATYGFHNCDWIHNKTISKQRILIKLYTDLMFEWFYVIWCKRFRHEWIL